MEGIDQLIGGGAGSVVGFAASYAVIQYRVKQLEKQQEDQKSEFSERMVGIKGAKKASMQSLREEIKEKTDIITKRIDKTQEKLEKHKDETREEFKSVVKEIHDAEKRIIQEIAKIK